MKLFTKLLSFFSRPPVAEPPAPLYTDAEFLDFVAEQARQRTRAEREARAGSLPPTQQAA